MRQKGMPVIEVRRERCEAYSHWMDERFPRYSWAAPDCQSYYRNAAGYPPFLFPGGFRDYRREHKALSLDDFQVPEAAGAHTQKAA